MIHDDNVKITISEPHRILVRLFWCSIVFILSITLLSLLLKHKSETSSNFLQKLRTPFVSGN